MDVDIDLRTNFKPDDYFPEAVRASRVEKGKLKPHLAGVYFQKIARDKISNLSAIPFNYAEDQGYFKIDMLHLAILDNFESKDEIRGLLKHEPDWKLLENPDIVGKLFQLHKHFDVVSLIKPKSVQELADAIAIIRPGKRYLLQAYVKDRNAIRTELYRKPDDGKRYFKKSHSLAYSLTIVLQLHLIKAGIL